MQVTEKPKSGQPIICQLFQLIPDSVFRKVTEDTGANHYYKKMLAKDHFVCLFYAVLTRSASLREVCQQMIVLGRSLKVLGMKDLPHRSTLSDANCNRTSKFFEQLYLELFKHYKDYLQQTNFILPIGGEVDASRVEIFDSTTITLFKDILKGAGRKPVNGAKKGGLKAFQKMNLLEVAPNFVAMRASATNEATFLQLMSLEKGSVGVMDKGFNSFRYYDSWCQGGQFFVTRMREGTIYEVVERKPVDLQTGVLSDQRIQVKYKNKRVPRTVSLRLVKYRDLATGISYHFLTNMMDEKPETIALLYKNRWTIELFFKRIKQNFELRYFLSDSENGIKSQIWVALIANLVFTVLERMTKRAEDFSTMVSMAAKNLCSFINFYHFISNMEAYRKAWVKRTFNLGNVQQIDFSQPRGT